MSQQPRVIVIGSGLAGLAAARELRDNGVVPILLEARDRVGGRVHSISFGEGSVINIGASLLMHGTGSPMSDLAQQADVQLARLADMPFVPGPGEAPMTVEDSDALSTLLEEGFAAIFDHEESGQALGPPLLRWLDKTAAERGLDSELLHCIADYITMYNGDELSKLARRQGFDEPDTGNEAGEAPIGGFVKILSKLAGVETLQSVRLGHVVTHIDYSAPVVRVRTREHGEFLADAALITVPLGVLKASTISFHPPLSPARQLAIQQLGYGRLTMVALEFANAKEPFWPASGTFCLLRKPSLAKTQPEIAHDLINRDSLFFINYQQVTGKPVLVACVQCTEGESLEEKTEEEVANIFGRHLARYFPNAPGTQPTRCTVGRWSQDPFSRGSYSFLGADTNEKNFAVLAAPCAAINGAEHVSSPIAVHPATLFWAGEHTIRDMHGSLDGAVLSGQRAATEVLTRFRV
ncbi:hypothetical protein THASP1DRAFT_24101 [Thamnocephalis sphaerospora]|uniref:Amine oxidase n=1 Tax=Thamnocephalis sphaerospora TaxID=78915 RepID=A0A4P9XP87_9FUNG|nr:hypothetical protein THASP1DRAFT_24101 [Thamnocephalis sphaerospora]|eukprot:RKP07805.1 hypothetical protein THASP1DRAFT_24101 [Thamnocephalis sphaerospora]